MSIYATIGDVLHHMKETGTKSEDDFCTQISIRQWHAAFPLMCGGLLFTKKRGIRCLTSGVLPDSCLQPQCGPQ